MFGQLPAALHVDRRRQRGDEVLGNQPRFDPHELGRVLVQQVLRYCLPTAAHAWSTATALDIELSTTLDGRAVAAHLPVAVT
ncbi:hypothetical protein KUA19_07550 [Catellatospora sp. NEAU-YM18]|nr:hypothetical protein [Catellatospora tritici]